MPAGRAGAARGQPSSSVLPRDRRESRAVPSWDCCGGPALLEGDRRSDGSWAYLGHFSRSAARDAKGGDAIPSLTRVSRRL